MRPATAAADQTVWWYLAIPWFPCGNVFHRECIVMLWNDHKEIWSADEGILELTDCTYIVIALVACVYHHKGAHQFVQRQLADGSAMGKPMGWRINVSAAVTSQREGLLGIPILLQSTKWTSTEALPSWPDGNSFTKWMAQFYDLIARWQKVIESGGRQWRRRRSHCKEKREIKVWKCNNNTLRTLYGLSRLTTTLTKRSKSKFLWLYNSEHF